MHEVGLAASIAAQLRESGADEASLEVRLMVRGSHADRGRFDDALRLHLAAELPGLDQRRVAITHAPGSCACVGCGEMFAGDEDGSTCPHCHAIGLLVPTPEAVELSWRRIRRRRT